MLNFAICISLLFAASVVRSADAFDVHYLSIGNSAYKAYELDIPDANLSARQVAFFLDEAGAKGGLVLESERNAWLTTDSVLSSLKNVIQDARQSANPMIVFYLASHGAFSSSNNGHVSILGGYTGSVDRMLQKDGYLAPKAKVWRAQLTNIPLLGIPPQSSGLKDDKDDEPGVLQTNEVLDLLDEANLPYVVILDSCFSRTPARGLAQLAEAVSDSLTSAGESLFDITKTVEGGRHAIYFAAGRGKFVQTQPHPLNETYSIGPLARRMILMLNDAKAKGQSVTFKAFDQDMRRRTFDPISLPGTIRPQENARASKEMLFRFHQ